MVDPEEHLGVPTTPPEQDKELAVAPQPESAAENPVGIAKDPPASDYDAIKELVFAGHVEDLNVLDDQVYNWKVEGWRSLAKKEHSPVFQAGGFPWRILLFPHGNNADGCSIYLEHAFEADTAIPDNWSCCCQFSLVLWNPLDPTSQCYHTAYHRFTKEESDWGFTRFVDLRKMFNIPWEGGRPLCESDTANITAYVRIIEDETGVLWHNFTNYDSKTETGFVGLKNQGATCYLNSLLQSLYFTNAFRKAIYEIPTQEDPSMSNSAYTLQRLFYHLQTSNSAVSTSELTKSFDWEARHVFEQQDVHELSRKLMERMEARMKGTSSETFLPQLFSGKIKTYISCINVEYESSRVEDFWDIQLNVSGNRTLHDSFQDYIQVEKMEGENQYFAGDQYRLQDANKGVIFLNFPDVLNLQLKRFEYDSMRDALTKINARYEFPEFFDAAPYLSPDADFSEAWDYQLQGVLVHSGDLNAGHYYAFLKPGKEGWFYKYDDDRVTKATLREVLEDNFGGEVRSPNGERRLSVQKKPPVMRPNSAYMLVYIRKSRLDRVMCPVTTQDIPQHLQQRVEEERRALEEEKKQRLEAHLYLNVKVVTDESFRNHGTVDLTSFDANPSVDASTPKIYRTLRVTLMKDLLAHIASDLGHDPKLVRLWVMVNRQNKTVRPDVPIKDLEKTVLEVFQAATANRDSGLRVWAEVAEDISPSGEPMWPSHQANGSATPKNDSILLFLKYFNADEQTLRGIGHIYLNKDRKTEDIVPLFLRKMSWGDKLPPDEKLMMWEEIKPNMIEPLKAKSTLKACELQHGDIITFQRLAEKKPEKNLAEKKVDGSEVRTSDELSIDRCETALEYYDFLVHKRVVSFFPHPTKSATTQYPPFELAFSSKISLEALTECVANHLGVQSTHLRFWTVAANGVPKTAIKRGPNMASLINVLQPANYPRAAAQNSDSLFFEVLDMTITELDANKSVKLTWLDDGISKETQLDVLVRKSGTTDDLVKVLVKKLQLSDETEGGKIRVYEASSHKFYRELLRDMSVLNINEYASLYAERIPDEEFESEENHFINVFHFQTDPSRSHGVPFRFLLIEGERFADTKKRLEKRTGIKGKAFEKIKFAVVRRASYAKQQYLSDDDKLWDVAMMEDDALGLDHADRSKSLRNGTGDLFLR